MAPDEGAQQQLPPQVTMGLLAYLITHSLDEDYEHVARQRRTAGTEPARRGRIGLVAALVLGVFALLVVVAGVQTSRNAVSADRQRRDLVGQITARKASLESDRSRISALQIATQQLEGKLIANQRRLTGLLDQVRVLSLRSGTASARGPGVEVVVDDAPGAAEHTRDQVLDTDLQQLVNGLWQAGAEAISINGERLTSLSSIRHAGDAITVNYRSLNRPYTLLVIGNADTLPARFADTASGQAWLDLQRDIHLKMHMSAKESLTLPAAQRPTLRYAEPSGGARP